MHSRLILFLFSLVTITTLASCGGMDTVVTVYPDGRAALNYEISAPTGKMPDLESMGKGDLAEIFKKDQYLSQDPQKLIDSLVTFGIEPLLSRMKREGKINDFAITDSQDFGNKKVLIAIKMNSHESVGPVHSAFKREIPALDSIFRKLTHRPASQPNDSIAIVKEGEELELQLHHFVIEPPLVEMTREERIENGRRMIDSIFNLITDPESIFGYMMGEGERAKMLDSINNMKSNMTDDMLDSMGRAYQFMDNASTELFKPKISLRAPVMLSNNVDELSGRISVSANNGMQQFEASTPYGEIEPGQNVFRQRFKLTMPPLRSTTLEERAEWRSILGWCDECEAGFEASSKPGKANITFYPAANGMQLIEVDCGMMKTDKVRAYFALTDRDGMPTVTVHQFNQAFYIDDPVSELRNGSPRFVTRKTDLLIGKINYDAKAQTLSVDRPSAKETFDLSGGAPAFRTGSYKDKAVKWIKHEGFVNNASELFEFSRCAEGTAVSEESSSSANSNSSGWGE